MKSLRAWYELRRFAARNDLVGQPMRVSGRLQIRGAGGNILVVEDDVEFRHISIEFNGTGNTLVFRAGSRPFGRFVLTDGGRIEIGKNSRFNKSCWLQANEGKTIVVGHDCLLADVRIRTSDIHFVLDARTRERLNFGQNVMIGNKVWIAEGAHVYKGVSIGDNAVIGAHAVVVKSVPAGCLAVGNPAVVVRENIAWR